MIAIVGFFVVIGAVLGGYLMEHGVLMLLYQPAELVIIGGAAMGSILISTPMKTIKLMIKQVTGIMKSGPGGKEYMDVYLRKDGR
mgnify:CR=1 FL=1